MRSDDLAFGPDTVRNTGIRAKRAFELVEIFGRYAFPSRVDHTGRLSTRQYARLVDEWVTAIGLRRAEYGTHSLRLTKAAMIYRATGNVRAIQILLGHTKIKNTGRYLGVYIEDAFMLAERTEV